MNKITEKLSTLPDKPGVYLHKDKDDEIIYIGKASSLKNRVRQYFQSPVRMDPKMKALVSHIENFEYIVTGNEVEALILENNLIKKHMPRYNVLLRDDKTFPYIKITINEAYPRILKTRKLSNDASKYFGPYADVKSVNTIIDLLNDVFRLKRCSLSEFPKGYRPCLNGHIDKCRMVCQGKVDHDEYMREINAIIAFLKGQDKAVINYLKNKMHNASECQNYEEAARYRDYMNSANSVIKKQRVELLSSGDMDIILASEIVGNHKDFNITVFFVRDGRLSGREIHRVTRPENESGSDMVAAFIKQYYSSQSVVPKEILLEEHISDENLVTEFLSRQKGQIVKIHVPERGNKKDLLKLAKKNTEESVRVQRQQLEKNRKLLDMTNSELAALLDTDDSKLPKGMRLEAYDISHTGGKDAVGAMVVFENGKAIKKKYRRFKVRSEDGSDDYGNMQEVVYRRLKRGINKDPGFMPLPDLLLIDGGKGHVGSVKQVVDGLNLNIPIVGMVKDDKHRTKGLITEKKEIDLKDYPHISKLIGTIQEEVHRYVIDYHRGVRNKSSFKSELNAIPGIGPKRRMQLMMKFGSIDSIKSASIEELKDTAGMNRKAAEAIYSFFSEESKTDCGTDSEE